MDQRQLDLLKVTFEEKEADNNKDSEDMDSKLQKIKRVRHLCVCRTFPFAVDETFRTGVVHKERHPAFEARKALSLHAQSMFGTLTRGGEIVARSSHHGGE